MAKRDFVIVGLLVLSGISVARYAVADTSMVDDGCTVLSEIVRKSLLSHAIIGGRYPVADEGPDYAGVQSCSNTAAAVSMAFRATLKQMDIATRWSLIQPGAVAMCDSHNLGICYPIPDPMGPALLPRDLEYVQYSWRVVRIAVIAHMPWGADSDMSHFDASLLAARLGASIRNPVLPRY